MNASQLLAWLTCLALAFFAAILAVHNSAQMALIKKHLDAVSAPVEEQKQLFQSIDQSLREIRTLLERGNPTPAPAGKPATAAARG